MSYYGNNWNRPTATEEVDISGQVSSGDDRSRFGSTFDPNRVPPGYGQQGQMNAPMWQQQQQQHGNNSNNFAAKQYNDYLERQGIPTITPEDLQILKECGRESLYFRCLPLTAAFCAGIVFTARARQWKPSFYHYLGAVFVGYFTGKISYRSTCEDKLINSRSNSPFVNAIRKRRGLYVEEFAQDNLPTAESSAFESDWTTPAKTFGIDEFDRDYKDSSFPQSHNSTRRTPFGSRDEFVSPDDLQDGSTVRPGTTYDDLRLRNRSSMKNA